MNLTELKNKGFKIYTVDNFTRKGSKYNKKILEKNKIKNYYLDITSSSKFERLPKFDLIIDLQSKFRNSLILKRIPHFEFYSETFNNFFATKKTKYKSKNQIENLSIFLDEKIKTINFNYNKLPKNLLNEAKRLLPKLNLNPSNNIDFWPENWVSI